MTDTHSLLPPADRGWLERTIARNRALYGGWSMAAGGDGGDGGTGDGGTGQNGGDGGTGSGSGDGTPTSFTQDDVDRLVGKARTEERQKAAKKFGDYDDLKSRAEGAKTLEDRLNDLESQSTAAKQRALRAEIAAEFGISTKKGEKDEPSDAELFLTGTDEEAMRSQALRLAGRESERRKKHPRVPKEGTTTSSGTTTDDDEREYARTLFGGGA
ncbi:hypothetical protein GCM10023340_08440 [Nocardioides marinquilinus]|uniref:Scaffolding protein n=1 Tax=Nocardioides marinquilinus TaxID=1210400 RepID=A0ABP9PA74_9ACTN